MSINVRAAAMIAGSALFLALGMAQPAAAAGVLTVDDDAVQCPTAAYSTISAAVAAASAGDTVKVCAGIYPESVQINKPLTLSGAKAGLDGRTARGTLSRESVVVNPVGDILIGAGVDGVTIDGFTLQGAGNDTAPHYGVEAFRGGSGLRVVNNVIRNNSEGINFQNPNGSMPALIEHNAFINNSNGTTAEGGTGVFISNGPANSTSIVANSFTGHRETAVNFAGSPTPSTGLVLADNRSVNDSTFVVAINSTNALVDGNVIKVSAGADNGSAILDFGSNTNLRISSNVIVGGAATLTSGIRLSDLAGASVGTTVTGNKVSHRFNGIKVSATYTSAFIAGNSVSSSANIGIWLLGGSNNVVARNTVSLSAVADCQDDSKGNLTAGTANTWIRDVGASHNSLPAGICR